MLIRIKRAFLFVFSLYCSKFHNDVSCKIWSYQANLSIQKPNCWQTDNNYFYSIGAQFWQFPYLNDLWYSVSHTLKKCTVLYEIEACWQTIHVDALFACSGTISDLKDCKNYKKVNMLISPQLKVHLVYVSPQVFLFEPEY